MDLKAASRPSDGHTFEELVTPSYFLYGLRLATNKPLPGIPSQRISERAHVRIELESKRQFPTTPTGLAEDYYNSLDASPGCEAKLRVGLFPDRQHFGLFYGDGARFAVDRWGSEVWADWPENYTLEDACTYLVGPVMGFVLRLRGTVSLHASAVAVADRAIALVGPPGSGKSTTAAAFACCGFSVLSDDIVALSGERGQCFVQPGYPRVNLWPNSVCRLFGSEKALPHITPTWDKRYLPLGENGYRFASNPLPLGAIYILDSRDSALTAPTIEEISGKEAFMALVANTYVNYLLDQDMRRTEFEVLSRVVSEIPLRRVCAPEEPSAIFGLCEAIADDAKRVMAAVPANATSVLG